MEIELKPIFVSIGFRTEPRCLKIGEAKFVNPLSVIAGQVENHTTDKQFLNLQSFWSYFTVLKG